MDLLYSFLVKYGISVKLSFTILCDSICINVSNLSFHTKMKHIAMDFNFVRERIEEELVVNDI